MKTTLPVLDLTADELSRRNFVKVIGATTALAAMSGCVREPEGNILAYQGAPPDAAPGESRHYATSMTLDGLATGLLVRSRDGRPIKIEGNPQHPASRGAAGVFEQAALLELYDPERMQRPRHGNQVVDWDHLRQQLSSDVLSRRVGSDGARLAVLLEPTTSPLTAALIGVLRARYPAAHLHYHAPCGPSNELVATRSLLGAPMLARYDFTRARTIVAFGADMLAAGPAHLRHARDWGPARARGIKLHVAESAPTPTGSVADRHIAAAPSRLASLASALWIRSMGSSAPASASSPDEDRWINDTLAAMHAGGAVFCAGAAESVALHQLVCALNHSGFAARDAVEYAPSPIIDAGEPTHDVHAFRDLLASGRVDTLVVAAQNPCYAAPADVPLQALVAAIPNSFYLSAYDDETSSAIGTAMPRAHFLESWGSARAFDGTISPVQPLIQPLHDGRTVDELLAMLVDDPRRGKQLLAAYHAPSVTDDALRRGVVAGSRIDAVSTRLDAAHADALVQRKPEQHTQSGTLELRTPPSAAVHDGQFAANAWLQELPDPVTKLTWDNALWLAPQDAARLSLRTGDVAAIGDGTRTVDVPIIVVPGHAIGAATLPMGYGRRGPGLLATSIGVNANLWRRADNEPFVVTVTPTTRNQPLAITQEHWSIEGRSEAIDNAPPPQLAPDALYQPHAVDPAGFGADQWAMTIDLDRCTGCSACVIACQAENNIPVVGKSGVLRAREMHWMRIDRYIGDDPAGRLFTSQPMLCQHCEKAPCEYVCPVGATVHSDDGLNEMVYNRCVGTRFCSNNCPYKVRRFNWFEYNKSVEELSILAHNPDVTVRSRGVMEKCTFCVQRIREAQRTAELAGANETGPVLTACQQGCSTGAIRFGSLTASDGAMAAAFHDHRAFAALDALGTRPRVRYLRRSTETGA